MNSNNIGFNLLVASQLLMFGIANGLSQEVFRIGSWCLQGATPISDIIQFGANGWELRLAEKTNLNNLGLNFFIACLGNPTTTNAEQAMNNFGIEKSGAFKSNMSVSPPNASSSTTYDVWRAIDWTTGGPGNQTWQNYVNNGYASMNTLYTNKTGVHSFLAGAEHELNNSAKYSWLQYICNSVHVNAPGVSALVQAGHPTNLNALFQIANNIDVFESAWYPFWAGLPGSGSVFQDSLQTYVAFTSYSASALRTYLPNTPLQVILQAHEASGTINFRRPTKPEILCEINLAFAYGAKGMVYYLYSTTSDGQSGLLDANRNTTMRYDTVKAINDNYQNTGQKLSQIGANFTGLTWQAGFSIHRQLSEPISSTYKLYDVTAKVSGGATDAPAQTYVEVGILQNAGNVNHYMVVNRRCTAGETRDVTLVFQTTSGNAYRITDVYTGAPTTCYPAGATTLAYTLTLGPGQGKLLKLEDLGAFSGTITSNTTWSGNICVNANVIVNSGVTLTVSPGAIVQFAAAQSLTINGSLVADSNDPTKRITFTGTTATPGFWNGLIINANSNVSTLRRCDVEYATNGMTITYTGNLDSVWVEKCKIRYHSYTGILVDGANYNGASKNPRLLDNTISNNGGNGTDLYDYARPTIRGNRIENNTGSGIFGDSNCNARVEYNYIANNGTHGLWLIISCYANVHRNTITNNGTRGITCAANSNLIACGATADTTTGRNEITGNTGVGIYASTSSPNFGKDLATLYGNNWIHDNTGYEAQQTGSGYPINARRCYWSGQQSNTSGTVNKTPVLGGAPANPPAGWGRSTNFDPTLRMFRTKDDIIVAQPFNEMQYAIQTKAGASSIAAIAGITDWTADLQAAIETGKATGDWSKAGDLITALHRELQEARVPNVDFTLVNNYVNDNKVAAFIRKMLALVLMEKDLNANDIAAALAKLTAFSASNPENAAEFLLNAGAIQLYRVNNADALLKPDIALLSSAALPTDLVPAQNYPNPFNPETVICFHLNERQKVRLLIFDLNGKLVQTLFDGELASGAQTILWDGRDRQGRNVASGVYFYELLAGNQIERKRMTLVR